MVLFNHATREMTAKIVYYGPGLCGKTTNLLVIYDRLAPDKKGKMLSLATRSDRTLFFDLLPVEVGKIGSFDLKIQLYTVPGQVFYNETRKLVLRGADAVVFVADSQASMVQSDRESFENLLENLRENELDPDDTPIVVQYNKRDIPGVLELEELQRELGLSSYPSTAASALRGDGVMETFQLITKLATEKLLARIEGRSVPSEARDRTAETATSGKADEPAAVEEQPAAEATEYAEATEISVDELLEGRDRPLHFGERDPQSGDSDIDELDQGDLVQDEPAEGETPGDYELGSSDGDSRLMELEGEIQTLRSQVAMMQDTQREVLEKISKSLLELDSFIKSTLES